MSGHSKWATIKRKKAVTDQARGKLFSKYIKEITIAARQGGGDVEANPRLRTAVAAAKSVNMPANNIERASKRGTGEIEGATLEETQYEGYGPGGAAILLDCLTDNRTRTVAEVRPAFTKNGGNLGSDGSVAYLFKHCGQFVFAPGTSEDKVMEAALDAGAEDVFKNDDDSVELGVRNIKVALRRLRRFARQGAATELDLDGTIAGTARNGGWLDLHLRPERHNAVKILLFLEHRLDLGSADDHLVARADACGGQRLLDLDLLVEIGLGVGHEL